MIVRSNEAPQARPAQTQRVRMGIDHGGMLLATITACMLKNMLTKGFAARAREWFEECAAHSGATHVFTINYVALPKLKDLLKQLPAGRKRIDEGI